MDPATTPGAQDEWPLSPEEYLRYGRQMIMPEWGLQGQLCLREARVAVIGAGGLGCPVLQYLAGAGVGHISIFDHDTVSVSNLHRQVLHTAERVGWNKARSACIAISAINPLPKVQPHEDAITPDTAVSQLASHDLILDCTDRPLTRYMINDAATALAIPLVSGAAVGAAGQWAVYGGSSNGKRRACYRCLWPKVGASQRCDDAGVWGPVTGMVGSGMAATALSVLMERPQGEDNGDRSTAAAGSTTGAAAPPSVLHVLHLGGSPMVRTVKMRGPSPTCPACGPTRSIDVATEDYATFCGAGEERDEGTGLVPGGEGERIDVQELRNVLGHTVVVDTRPPVEYALCALPHTTNIPLATILATPDVVPAGERVIFLCRRGNDSQLAATQLRTVRTGVNVQDVRGGLRAWTRVVDPKFPVY